MNMTKFDNEFAVFILTHGRADKVITYEVLRKQGYTGRIYLMVDDEDAQIDDYKRLYGDQVIVFSKQEAIDMTDAGDNFKKRNGVVFARNYNFKVAKDLKLKYFLQLDDDYTGFAFAFDNQKKFLTTKRAATKNLDRVFRACVKFLVASDFDSVAFGQGGDFIGGQAGRAAKLHVKDKFLRKVMNTFFFRTDRPLKFMGSINEDVNLYVSGGLKGKKFATIMRMRIDQKQTQSNSGGLTDIYLDLGTYIKSFYSVMYAPSCVHVYEMGVNHKRLHHMVTWKNTAPLIIDEKWKQIS